MSCLKLFKTNAVHILLPQAILCAAAAAVVSIGTKENVTFFTSAASCFELILYAAIAIVSFTVLKTTFSLSVCCNVPRTKAFAAQILTIVCSALIMLPFLAADAAVYKYYLETKELILFDDVPYHAGDHVGQLIQWGQTNAEWMIYEFVGLMICGFAALTFFTIMSRLERVGKIINIGIILILISALVSATQNGLAEKLSSVILTLHRKAPYFQNVLFAAAVPILAAAAFLAFMRKPVRNTKGA